MSRLDGGIDDGRTGRSPPTKRRTEMDLKKASLDSGAMTKDEYEKERKKILEK